MEVKVFSNSKQKKEYFLGLQENECTYIVADLESKKNLQNLKFSNGSQILEENFLMRVNEFWKKISAQIYPELTIISKEIFQELLQEWGKDEGHRVSSAGAKEIFNYMLQLAPLISEESHRNVLSEWFLDNKESYSRWGEWYELSHIFWKKLEKCNFAPAQFLPALLLKENLKNFYWDRKIVFDLIVELTSVEAHLIQKLSQQENVIVLDSRPNWFKDLSSNFVGYSVLSPSKRKLESSDSGSCVDFVKLHRLNTELSEVKMATGQARRWLDQGVLPEQIAIFAPDIESYWPSLRRFLDKERIPYSKPTLSKLHSFPQVLSWMAFLRVSLGSVCAGDIELSEYKDGEAKILSFARFKRMFSIVYNKKDLQRVPSIQALYQVELGFKDQIFLDEFIAFCVKHWKFKELREIKMIIDSLLKSCPRDVRLSVRRWMSILEKSLSQLKLVVEPGHRGISCLNLSSIDHAEAEYICFIGLVENKMRQKKLTALSERDIESLSKDIGFDLSYLEDARNEYYLRWGTESCKEAHYITSYYSFSGKNLVPSNYWLHLNSLQTANNSVATCFWSELQRQDFETLNKFCNKNKDFIDQIRADCGKERIKPIVLQEKLSLSVTQLENYATCPFIFASRKIFSLEDFPALDVDTSALEKGTFLHALFKRLIEAKGYESIENDKVDEILEELRKSQEHSLVAPSLWPIEKRKYRELAIRFCEFERQWRKKFFHTQSVGLELSFEVYWDFEKGKFSSCDEKGLLFRGKIDRLDSDEKGNYVVIDYKLGGSSAKNYSSWLKNDSFQLSLYSQIIEEGFVEPFKGSVVEASYFVVKDFIRGKGFRLAVEGLSEICKGKRHGITEEKKQALYKKTNERVQELVQRLRAGDFEPAPRKKAECDECHWRVVCRAKHLNS